MLEIFAVAAHEAAEHVYPTAFGVAPHGWTAIAMLVVFGIMLWAGVPRIIAGILDSRIEGIRKQLNEAATLRAEAEALRDEYARKTVEAEKDIVALRAGAEKQASEIVAQAKVDAAALIVRHTTLAEEKIATAERDAVQEVRAKVANAAVIAARELITSKHDADADKKLVDEAISAI